MFSPVDRHVLAEVAHSSFLIGINHKKSILYVHAAAGHNIGALRLKAEKLAINTGTSLKSTVKTHPLRSLAFPKSLEFLMDSFAVDEVIHDPTMILERSLALVSASKSCRALAGTRIGGTFFDQSKPGIVVWLRSGCSAEIQTTLRQVVAAHAQVPWGDRLHVEITDILPRRRLVPVDRESASVVSKLRRTVAGLKRSGAVALTTAALTVPAAAYAATPRVDGTSQTSQYGVLAGLSIFNDGEYGVGAGEFSSSALQLYFDERETARTWSKVLRLVQDTRRPRDPEVVGQTPGGGGGPGS